MPAARNLVFFFFSSICLMGIPLARAQVPFGPQGERVSVSPVATVVAEEGETDLQFLLHRGKLLRGFTASTGFEACAQVCRAADGRMGLAVYTSNAHIGCLVVSECPKDMGETGETIHSHPQTRNFISNDADRAFLRARSPGTQVKRHERGGINPASGFSQTDYAGGPGYLVEGDTLWHQSGLGTARKVGLIPAYKD